MTESANKTTHAQRRRKEAQNAMRLKLRAGQFIRRLREIAKKAEEVEPSKVPALRLQADIYSKLLGKCLPDLKAIEHSGETVHRHVTELSDADLLNIATGSSPGVAAQADSETEPTGVH